MTLTQQQKFPPRRFRIAPGSSTYRKEFQPPRIELNAIDECWVVNYDSGSCSSRLYESGDTTTIYIQFENGQLDDIPMLLQRWLRDKAEKVLTPEIRTIAKEMDVTFNRLRVKNQRTLWGSCSRLNNINLNQKLLFLSREVMSYVLYHELTHLKIFDHSDDFWRELERAYKNPKKAQKQLRYESKAYVPLWARI